MTATIFVDTNVLIYAVDEADPAKQAAAQRWMEQLWRSRRGRLSFQVLQEFYSKVTRKDPDARAEVRAEIRGLMAWQPVVIDAALLDRAWKIQDRYRLSFWDSAIVAAAKAASCRYLLTEDLQADQDLDGIMVINPFLRDPSELPA